MAAVVGLSICWQEQSFKELEVAFVELVDQPVKGLTVKAIVSLLVESFSEEIKMRRAKLACHRRFQICVVQSLSAWTGEMELMDHAR